MFTHRIVPSQEKWRKAGLHRLFPAFPGGEPGVGLLLLRLAVAVTAIIQGAVYLRSRAHPTVLAWAVSLGVIASATLVLIGFLTPVMSVLTGIAMIGTALSRLLESTPTSVRPNLSEILVVIMAAAIACLGPGAFSLDARLFGRREIIIPPSSNPTHSGTPTASSNLHAPLE